MNNKNYQSPAPKQQPIDLAYEQFVASGAETVHPDFNVAYQNQYDVVFKEKRYLLTPYNERSARYEEIAERAGMLAAKEALFANINQKNVKVYELPRNARTLLQTAVSSGNEVISNKTVFSKFGTTLKSIADRAGVTPDPNQVDLHTVLYSRLDDEVILNPGVEFVDVSPEAEEAIVQTVHDQLVPKYTSQGAELMVEAFVKGRE